MALIHTATFTYVGILNCIIYWNFFWQEKNKGHKFQSKLPSVPPHTVPMSDQVFMVKNGGEKSMIFTSPMHGSIVEVLKIFMVYEAPPQKKKKRKRKRKKEE